VFIIINLFGAGDVTWSVIAIPIVLLIEVVFFRKWCSHICPISALMSLVGKLNRTVLPRVNTNTCLEIHGIECGKCAHVCEMSIDPRHPERGNSWSECTRCRACVDNCPAHAIDMPLLNTPKKPEVDSSEKSNTAL
jgi:ferredoxin-type protein NapH